MKSIQPCSDLSITNLRLKFAGESSFIFKDLSFSVPQGQKVLLLGPSGCGKSTLLQVLSGIIPDSIEIPMRVDDIQKPDSWGIIFQDPDTQFCMSMVDEELAFVLENACVPRNQMQDRMKQVLAEAGLHLDHLHIPIHTLSQGMKQRLALASMLLLNPDVLFLDEPSAMLDRDGTTQIWDAIKRISKGKTVIIVEHKIDKVIDFADRIVLFNHIGEIIADGTPVEMFTNNKNHLVEYGIWYPDIWADYGRSQVYRSMMQHKQVHKPASIPTISADHQQPVLSLTEFSGYRERERKIYAPEANVLPGEWIAIVGENGAGKSTFLLSLMQLLKTNGSYLIQGRKVQQTSKRFKKQLPPSQLSFVFQNPEMQFVTNTVYEEIAFSLRLHRISQNEIDHKVKQLLSMFQLDVNHDRHPYHLSIGQKRRLSVAAAIVQNQPILLLDEPTFGLDAKNTFAMLEILEQLRAQGTAILMITHDSHIAHYFCDKVWEIENGQLININDIYREEMKPNEAVHSS